MRGLFNLVGVILSAIAGLLLAISFLARGKGPDKTEAEVKNAYAHIQEMPLDKLADNANSWLNDFRKRNGSK